MTFFLTSYMENGLNDDVLARFVSECCEKGDGFRVSVPALFDAYESFCGSSGATPRTRRSFGHGISSLGFGSASSGRNRTRTGLRLRAEAGEVTSVLGDDRTPNVAVRDKSGNPSPPGHLSDAMKAWFVGVVDEYELDTHWLHVLTNACEAWDRGQRARVALVEHGGETFINNQGNPTPRPEIAIERNAKLDFARLVRELALDGADIDDEPRLPRPRKGTA